MPMERDPLSVELSREDALRIEALQTASMNVAPGSAASTVIAAAESYLRFLKGEPVASAEIISGPRAVQP